VGDFLNEGLIKLRVSSRMKVVSSRTASIYKRFWLFVDAGLIWELIRSNDMPKFVNHTVCRLTRSNSVPGDAIGHKAFESSKHPLNPDQPHASKGLSQ